MIYYNPFHVYPCHMYYVEKSQQFECSLHHACVSFHSLHKVPILPPPTTSRYRFGCLLKFLVIWIFTTEFYIHTQSQNKGPPTFEYICSTPQTTIIYLNSK